MGSGGIAPLLSSLTLEGNELSSRPGRFSPGKSPRPTLGRRLVGPQSQSGRCGEKQFFALAGNRFLVVQPVAHHYSVWDIQALLIMFLFINESCPCNKPWKSIGLWDFEVPTFSVDCRFTDSGKIVRLMRRPPFTPQGRFLVLFLLEAESTPWPCAAGRIR
jgi:hypothetical protein